MNANLDMDVVNVNESPEVLTIPEAAKFLRISRSMAEKLCAKGLLPVVKLGRRRVCLRGALVEWMRKQSNAVAVES